MYKVSEALRLWVRGESLRSVERLVGVDRKTLRRYVTAGAEAGMVQDAMRAG